MDRPAYRVTVENVTRGWSYTTTQGDEPDPDADVQLTGECKLDWAFKNNEVPGQLEPDSGSFQLFVRNYDVLPYCEQGDIVIVELVRPRAVGDPFQYMTLDGRISDADLDQAPNSGVFLTITVVDPRSELDFDYDLWRNNEPGVIPAFQPVDVNVAWALREDPAPNFILPNGASTWTQLVYLPTNGNVGESIDRMLAGGLDLGDSSDAPGAPVLRTVTDWTPDPVFWNYAWPERPDRPLCYLDRWRPAIEEPVSPLFNFALDGDKVIATYDPDTITDDNVILALDAKHVLAPQDWTKDRKLSPNRIEISGSLNPTGTGLAQEPRSFETAFNDDASVAAKGVTTRRVDTTATAVGGTADLERIARDTLSLSADPEKWSVESLTVRTDTMTDAGLDHIARMFYPHAQPLPGKLGRVLVMVNIDAETDPTDGFYNATVVGTSFDISGGVLTITPTVRPINLIVDAGMSAGPTYTALAASAYGAGTYVDQGGTTDYLDPELSYDQLKFTAL